MELLIVGGGPAGLTAALYAARAGKDVTLIESIAHGGQMNTTPDIENFPAFLSIPGFELSQSMQKQAKNAGVRFLFDVIEKIEKTSSGFLCIGRQNQYEAEKVILATGAERRKLSVPGEEEFTGRGISYCAVCDGNFFRNKNVAVVGGGNTALEDALYLAKICKKVTLIHRRDSFRAAKVYLDRLKNTDNIELFLNTIVEKIEGDDVVRSLRLKIDEDEKVLPVSALFIAVGTKPFLPILPPEVERDENGCLMTDREMRTSLPGLYAAGDVRNTPLRQIVTACADGAIAGNTAANE